MSKKCDSGREAFVDSSVAILKSTGARITKTRLAILQILSEGQAPISARELFELVSAGKDAGKMDQVTVYRILETFKELGLVHRVFPSGRYLPCFHQHCSDSLHILIRCSSCEEISELDVPQETLAPMIWYLKGEHGFLPDDHLFQVNGVCSKCQKSQARA